LAVAAVIVTFNSASVIDACLEAVSKMAPESIVVVIDNASTDSTVEQVRARMQAQPGVRLIANRENRGFAGAVNQGVREAGDVGFVWLLNPDACVQTALDDLVKASRQYGLAAGKLVDAAGRAQAGFTVRRLPTPASLIFELLGINRLWPSNPVNRKYRDLDRDLEQPGPVEQPAGAFLMVRRDVWEKLGGLDERFYPVWFEDVDFCRRALAAGYRIEYVPSVAAAHEGGHSVGRMPAGCRAVYWCVSLLKYSEKYFRPIAFRGICMAVVLSSVPRMVAGMIAERSFLPLITYLKIMRFAGACLLSPAHIKETVPGNS
jgi:N-acetylglucosaminyl-diphospho-decaprenol L-rhamnosyltransferase